MSSSRATTLYHNTCTTFCKLSFCVPPVYGNASAGSARCLVTEDKLLVWNRPREPAIVDDDVLLLEEEIRQNELIEMNPKFINEQQQKVQDQTGGTGRSWSRRIEEQKEEAEEEEIIMEWLEQTGRSNDWQVLQFPSAYMYYNSPVTLCAVSNSGQQIALAGLRGSTLYNRKLSRWRMFGNINHEAAVRNIGLAWWGENILCTASIMTARSVSTISALSSLCQKNYASFFPEGGTMKEKKKHPITSLQGPEETLSRTLQDSTERRRKKKKEEEEEDDDDDYPFIYQGLDGGTGPDSMRRPTLLELFFFPRHHLDFSSLVYHHIIPPSFTDPGTSLVSLDLQGDLCMVSNNN